MSRAQLLAAGLKGRVIDYRLEKGVLQSAHRGVYRTGPVAARYAREMAAVLACGDRSVLSHRSASALWKLIPRRERAAPVEVIGPRTLRGPRRGVRLHRVHQLPPDEIDRRRGLPVTTVARTLLDLASCAGTYELERALAQADRRRLVTRDEVEELLTRHPQRRGRPALLALLRQTEGPAMTRSDAEARFLELIRKAGISRPRVNVSVEGLEVDFVWSKLGVIVEIDGFAYHSDRAAFERDRRRDGILAAAGYQVVRFTWRQLTEGHEAVLVRLAQALVLGGRARNSDGHPVPQGARERE